MNIEQGFVVNGKFVNRRCGVDFEKVKRVIFYFLIAFVVLGCTKECNKCSVNEVTIQNSDSQVSSENEKQKNEIQKSNEFLESMPYKKMRAVYVFLNYLEKIANAQNDLSIQQKNNAQPNDVIIENMIANFEKLTEEAFLDYKKMGGTANNMLDLQKRDKDCHMNDWRYVIPSSVVGFIGKEQQAFITEAAHCY